MLYQATTFREILKETWCIDKGIDFTPEAFEE